MKARQEAAPARLVSIVSLLTCLIIKIPEIKNE